MNMGNRIIADMQSSLDKTSSETSRSAGWKVRPYQPGDEAQVVNLFTEIFDKPLTEEQYRWKVVASPWPVTAPSVWLAQAGGQIIGQYAGTPMRFKRGDEIQPILHACDVMTAEKFRRQGVLTALGTAAHQAWARAGVPFITGMHYGGWGSRRRHLGWQEQFKMVWLWRILRPGQLLSSRLGLPAPLQQSVALAAHFWNWVWDAVLRLASRQIDVFPVEQPGPEFDDLWTKVGPTYEALVVRDRAWVTYRYHVAPGFGYRLLLARRGDQPVGYLAYRVTDRGGRRTGWIADMFTAPEDAPARAGLLRQVLNVLRAAGAQDVRALVPPGTATFGSFRRAGFLSGTGGFDASIVPLTSDLPKDVLRDPQRWFTMGGDFDVI